MDHVFAKLVSEDLVEAGADGKNLVIGKADEYPVVAGYPGEDPIGEGGEDEDPVVAIAAGEELAFWPSLLTE